jgi:hypothetical protein
MEKQRLIEQSKAKFSRQCKGKERNAKQSRAKRSEAKRSEAKQSKAKQSKAKQSKAKQSNTLVRLLDAVVRTSVTPLLSPFFPRRFPALPCLPNKQVHRHKTTKPIMASRGASRPP